VLYAVHATNTKTEARDFSRTSMKKSFVKLNGLETGCHHHPSSSGSREGNFVIMWISLDIFSLDVYDQSSFLKTSRFKIK
jgi:hypothetical protein